MKIQPITQLNFEDLSLKLEDFQSDRALPVLDVDASLQDVVIHFMKTQDQCLGLVKGDLLQGVISKNDALFNFSKFYDDPLGCAAKEIMIAKPFTLSPVHSIWHGMMLLAKKEVSSVPVVDQNNHLVSIHDYDEFLHWILKKIALDTSFNPELLHWQQLDKHIVQSNFYELKNGLVDRGIFLTENYRVIKNDPIRVDECINLNQIHLDFKTYRQPQCVVTNYQTMIKGVISAKEVFEYLVQTNFSPDPNIPIKNIMNEQYICLMYKHSFEQSLSLLLNTNNERIIVVDEYHFPVGILRTFDILKFITDKILVKPDENLDFLSFFKAA